MATTLTLDATDAVTLSGTVFLVTGGAVINVSNLKTVQFNGPGNVNFGCGVVFGSAYTADFKGPVVLDSGSRVTFGSSYGGDAALVTQTQTWTISPGKVWSVAGGTLDLSATALVLPPGLPYMPGDPAAWGDTPPATVKDALDRLASAVWPA